MQRPHRRFAGILALSALMAAGLGACGDDDTTGSDAPEGSDSVSIEMGDYSFTVSGPLTAGGSIKLSNIGKEIHMVGLGKLKPGKTMADLQTALSQAGPPEGGAGETTTSVAGGTTSTSVAGGTTTTTRAGGTTTTTAAGTTTTAAGATTTTAAGGGAGEEQDPTADIITDVGLPGGFMGPGESAEVSAANLTEGSYALICFIPTEVEGMPHFAKGMVNQLEVVGGTTPSKPTADATYKLAKGLPVEGPATLTAGKHTLQFDAAAGSEQLEPGLTMLNPGATLAQLNDAFVRIFESDAPPPKGAADLIPAKVIYGGFDMEDVTSFYLTVDLKPGNYYILAGDTDEENAPQPPIEMLNITVT